MNTASSSRFRPTVEILESRIAPAAVLSFTDADGQLVTITTSKGTLSDLQAAVFPLPVDAVTPTQVKNITLGTVFQGTDLTILTGTAADTLHTKIGYVNATGIDLGKVSIDGDLGQIDAGDANSATAALKSLTVDSWGHSALSIQGAGASYESKIIGSIGTLTVATDFENGILIVEGSNSEASADFDPTDLHGKITSLNIGGNLLGGSAAGSASITTTDIIGKVVIGGSVVGGAGPNSGNITSGSDMGSVTVGGDVKGFTTHPYPLPEPPRAIIAGTPGQEQNGRIFSGGTMGSIHITGSVLGGDGDQSGQIGSTLGMGALTVDVDIIGGLGVDSGAVGSGGKIGTISIGRDVIGSDGVRSGAILSTAGMKTVTIGGNLQGGLGDKSGFIASDITMANVTIEGSILGGGGAHSGSIGSTQSLGAVLVKGSLEGGSGISSGQVVSAAKIKSVTILGSVIGGSQFESGSIGSFTGIGAIAIGGDLVAGSGERSGIIATDGQTTNTGGGAIPPDAPITSITITGSIKGQPVRYAHAGLTAGSILSGGDLGAVKIGGAVTGGDEDYSGFISSEQSIRSVSIGGQLAGAGGYGSGSIQTTEDLGNVFIGGDLFGGDNDFSGTVFSGGKIAKVDVLGSVVGGNGAYSGSIETDGEASAGNLGPVFIGGSLVGGTAPTANNSGEIFSSGQLKSVTIGTELRGVITGGNVVGGFAPGSGSISSDLDLGTVVILGNLQGSAADETGKITSGGKLTSVFIGGSITSQGASYDTTSQAGNQFGQIYADGALGTVTVIGAIEGGDGNYSGQIRAISISKVTVGGSIEGGDGIGSGSIFAYSLDIGSVTAGGVLAAGTGAQSGWIAANGSIGTVTVQDLSGSSSYRPRISAVDTIKAVNLTEGAFYGDILAGYNTNGNGVNPYAQIGTVKIGVGDPGTFNGFGNMQGTNIVAGINTGDLSANGINDRYFGTSDDLRIPTTLDLPRSYPKIASVVIQGKVLTTDSGSDHYGIVAEQIGALKVEKLVIKLKAGAKNDGAISIGNDTSLREVGTLV